MKIRTGFVSNSSSSSFTINKTDLTDQQLILIRNHHTAQKHVLDEDDQCDNGYFISENDFIISGLTIMDNFSMSRFLENIGVPSNVIHWDE